MGGEPKFLRRIDSSTLLDRVVERLAPQVSRMIIAAGPNGKAAATIGLPTVSDAPWHGRGPLAGILAGLRLLSADPGAPQLAISIPADTPFFPLNLVARLVEARTAVGAEISIASSRGRLHPAVVLWPTALAGAIEQQLSAGPSSSIGAFLAQRRAINVDFDAPFDPFHNVNTPVDLEAAVTMARNFAF
jgi:molybdopterin-guanine dinucleotide biosynthesis protein A